MKKVAYKPVGNRVLILRDPEQEMTAQGLLIPEKAREQMRYATVVAVGDEVQVDVKPGDRIITDKYKSVQLEFDGVTYDLMMVDKVFMVERG